MTAAVMQAGGIESPLVGAVVRVVGLAMAGGALAATTAALYRWYARERLSLVLPTILSLAVVAVYLNTTPALQAVLGGERGVFDLQVVLVNAASFVGAALVVPAAVRAGDRLAGSVGAVTGAPAVDAEMSQLVRAVGRVVAVELPEEIDDVEGYDPVAPATKAELAGKRLVFPRRLTVAELRDRLAARLRDDYGVGHVDVEIADDGTVKHLGVGSRAAGLGPTLQPRTVALAIHADPAFGATPGDRVAVYRPGDPPERVASGELRAAAGDIVTLAVDAADAPKLDDATRYRLATLPASPRPEQEFAGLLRAADETMGVVTVGEGAALAGTPVGALAVPVVAVRPADGPAEPIPPRSRVLAAGDTVYAVGRPEALRRLEAGAAAGVTTAARG